MAGLKVSAEYSQTLEWIISISLRWEGLIIEKLLVWWHHTVTESPIRSTTWTNPRPSMGARAPSVTEMRPYSNTSRQTRTLSMEGAKTSLEINKMIKSIIPRRFKTLADGLNPMKGILQIKSHSHLQMYSSQLRILLCRSFRLRSRSFRLPNNSFRLHSRISKPQSKVWLPSHCSKLLSRVSVNSHLIRVWPPNPSSSLLSNSSSLHIERKR